MRRVLIISLLLFFTIGINAAVPQDSVYYSLYKFLQKSENLDRAMQEQRVLQYGVDGSEFEFAQEFIWVYGVLTPHVEGIAMDKVVDVYEFGYKGSSGPGDILIKNGDKYYIYDNYNENINPVLGRLLTIKSDTPHNLPDNIFIKYMNALCKLYSYNTTLRPQVKIGVVYDCTPMRN